MFGYDVDHDINWSMPAWMPAEAVAVIKGLITCDPSKRMPLTVAIERLRAC